MSEYERIDPTTEPGEVEVLVSFLDWHRATLFRKTEGLDAEQLAQRIEPSTMTLGGMLKHLAFVEDWWFNSVFADNPVHEPWTQVDWRRDRDWDWDSAKEQTSDELRALLEREIATSRRITDEALARPEGLDAVSRRQSHRRAGKHFNLRWILVHMIEEYARHNGHADLLRETIDGTTGE